MVTLMRQSVVRKIQVYYIKVWSDSKVKGQIRGQMWSPFCLYVAIFMMH